MQCASTDCENEAVGPVTLLGVTEPRCRECTPAGADTTDSREGDAAVDYDDRRCIKLWSNPNDVVWSPFMGIGSEGVVALENGRRFVGAELKASYFRMATANLREAEKGRQAKLFA
jgi:hypothetical protein